jgi:hypothetical protein
MLDLPTFPVLDKPTHHDYGANELTLPGTVVDGVPPLHAASDILCYRSP